jgi:hypothetical protein
MSLRRYFLLLLWRSEHMVDHLILCMEMAEHQKKSEAELNGLLTEYWKLRHETGAVLLLPSQMVEY